MTGQLYSVDELLDQAVKGSRRSAETLAAIMATMVADLDAHRRAMEDAGVDLPTASVGEDEIELGQRHHDAQIYPMTPMAFIDPSNN